jgi:CBS domain-containing protein
LRVKNIGALVATSGKAVLGLISEREIVHAFSRYGETAASMPVKEIMRHGVVTVSPDESVSRVIQLMTRYHVRHMPVLRDGKRRYCLVLRRPRSRQKPSTDAKQPLQIPRRIDSFEIFSAPEPQDNLTSEAVPERLRTPLQ